MINRRTFMGALASLLAIPKMGLAPKPAAFHADVLANNVRVWIINQDGQLTELSFGSEFKFPGALEPLFGSRSKMAETLEIKYETD
jgi:hypothetical protein